jgi:indolepyruvate ferredoxin oxidoreductase alpha subunit
MAPAAAPTQRTIPAQLLSGNEAIALGAYHAGVTVAAAYPGTPSTEILESIARFDGVYAEWSPNEKVALEVATGASYAGARALASMKHVGVNVAADPFFAVAVTGVRGGLVVISADDPSMHSSQNEQDNRYYARFAKVPLLEPADSQEAYDLTRLAFDISEEFDTPVLLRSTTRISHAKSVVAATGERLVRPLPLRFARSPEKLVMIPAYARRRRPLMEERIERLAAYSEAFTGNQIIPGDCELGIVSSGVAYQYAREVFPDATFLKLALTYPLPVGLVREIARQVERLIVVEELEPFLEDAIRALGVAVEGKAFFPNVGELSVQAVAEGARKADLTPQPPSLEGSGSTETVPPSRAGKGDWGLGPSLPVRPPVPCPGCPHTAGFYALRRMGVYRGAADPSLPPELRALAPLRRSGAVITGDIGCYTLACLPPLLALDTTGCMGASIGNALGMEKAGLRQKVVAVIGDSTFLHSGITPLLDVVYNGGSVTVLILDNETTAMTGHQEHPGTGLTAKGVRTKTASLEAIVRAVGVEDVQVVDAFDLPAVEAALRAAVDRDEPSVVIARGACILKVRGQHGWAVVEASKCDGCAACLRTGCPAIGMTNGVAEIDPGLCVGERCAVCLPTCPHEAITLVPGGAG